MKKANVKNALVTEQEKRILRSYINQSYILKKYQALKLTAKDVVKGIFERARTNVIIVDDKRFVQKIERQQNRFDSSAFIEHVKKSKDFKLQLLVKSFYKTIETLEFKPYNDEMENKKKGSANA